MFDIFESSNNGWFNTFIEGIEDVDEDAIVELEVAIVVLWVEINSGSDTMKRFLILWISNRIKSKTEKKTRRKISEDNVRERERERERISVNDENILLNCTNEQLLPIYTLRLTLLIEQ